MHHRWFHNQFSPFFPVLHCPLGFAELQACPFPDVFFPPLPLSDLSSFPFHCALQDGFGQEDAWKGIWATENREISTTLKMQVNHILFVAKLAK